MKNNLLFIRNTMIAKTRKDTLDGKDYLVVPCVMIVEGVHNGSQGALFYSKEELSKFTCCWNMKPALLRHPDSENSGTTVDILRNQGMGLLLNTEFVDGKLKTEVWIDVEKADQLDSRIVERIENNEKIEVSTGLFTELDQKPGVWNEEDFVSSTLNYRPDHLAILLDSTGACSIDDGAGMLQNKKGSTLNELSHRRIHDELNRLVRENLTDQQWAWAMDVYEKFFIYEIDDKFYQQDYTISSDDDVSLSGEAVQVKREVEYKPITQNQEVHVKRDEVIAALIANGKFNDGDQGFLKGLTDDQLSSLTANAEKPASTVEAKEEAEVVENNEAKSSQVVADHVKNNDTSVEAFLKSAPPEIQAVLNQGLAILNERKTKAVEAILANEANGFSKEILNEMKIDQLEMIAKLAGPAVVENKEVVKDAVVVDEVVENADIPVLETQTLFAPQVSTSPVENEDIPTLNVIPMFDKENK